jgi:hypothetical protein
VKGAWRILFLLKTYSSQYIKRMIKIRKAREAGTATCIGDIRSNFKVLVGKREECTYAYIGVYY